MNNAFRLIVFDWDGTLIDSEARIVACFLAAAQDLGLPGPPRAAVREVIGLGLQEACARLVPGLGESGTRSLAERYRHHFLEANGTPSAPFQGVGETLSWLREQGYAMAVATGKGRRGLDRALIETGFKRFFDATRCADETHSKPHPRMLLEIMEELAVSAEQTLMVGDTEYDMEMAHNAGAARVAVCYGVHEAERLLRWSPLACVERIDALKEILARLPRGGCAQAAG